MKTATQQQFLKDLQSFIKEHPHYKDNEGTHKVSLYNGTDKFSISDPDGNYEAIEIKINLIS